MPPYAPQDSKPDDFPVHLSDTFVAVVERGTPIGTTEKRSKLCGPDTTVAELISWAEHTCQNCSQGDLVIMRPQQLGLNADVAEPKGRQKWGDR